MSVRGVTFYTVVCDRCGKDGNEDTDYAAYSDEASAREVARGWDDWLYWLADESGRDYCPECWRFDEDDERVPRPPLPTVPGFPSTTPSRPA